MSLPTLDLSGDVSAHPVTGGLVDNMQGLLKATQRADCDPGGIDGQGGPHTRQALLNFQRIAGLATDAVCGQQTWTRLITW